jgi:hypothetical protein
VQSVENKCKIYEGRILIQECTAEQKCSLPTKIWSNPMVCSENYYNNKMVEKRKNGDKGDKKSSQGNTTVMS